MISVSCITMVRKLSISISDFVFKDVEKEMKKNKKSNRSEFIDEMIRLGLVEYKKKN